MPVLGMGALASFMGFYLVRPRLMREHLAIAARTLTEEGVTGLVAEIRAARGEVADRARLRAAARLPGPEPAKPPEPGTRAGTILVAVHDMDLGGAQKVARTFARWLLAETSYGVRFVALRDGPFRPRFEAIAPVFCLADHGPGPAPALRAWAGGEVRAILVNSAASGAVLDHWPDPTPAVAFVHELPRMLARHADGLERIRSRCARVVGGSGAVTRALAGAGIPADRLVPAHAFVAAEETAPDPAAAADRAARRRALGIGPQDLLVAGCGVLHWRKSPLVFIEVAEHVRRALGRRARFVWIGGGPDRAACERRIAAAGLRGAVTITGFEPDLRRALAAADLFLLPSEEDPFPLVALHAALAGLPLVCFEGSGGVTELAAQGCGTAVAPRDAAAMAAAVLAYAADPGRRAREGEAGRALVARAFTDRAVAPALLAALEAVMDGT